MLEPRYSVDLAILPLCVLSINRQSFLYNNKQAMDNTQFWKRAMLAAMLQPFYCQFYNRLPCLDSTPLLLQNPYSSAQKNSKQFPQSEQALQSSGHSTAAVRLKRMSLKLHLAWLKHSILKTVDRLLWDAFAKGNFSNYQFDQISQDDSLLDYLQEGKSLVPTEMIQAFVGCLTQQPSLKKVLTWLYEHVQPKFGDELILLAFKIVMVYCSLTLSGLNNDQIRVIVLLPFNLIHIHNDPSLRILHYSSFCKENDSSGLLDPDLYRFCVAYIDTILLVLGGFSQNPYYKQIQEHEKEAKVDSTKKPWEKRKKIVKRK